MSKRALNIIRITAFFVLVLAYQNCSVVSSGPGSASGSSSSIDKYQSSGGNGDGYAGLHVDAPSSMKPGESAQVIVSGGTPPYDLKVDGQGSVKALDDRTYLYSVGGKATPGVDTLHVQDAVGASVSTNIEITTLQVDEVRMGNFFGRTVVLKDGLAVIGASGYSQFFYSSGAVFTFDVSRSNYPQSKIFPPNSNGHSTFGSWLDYDGKHAIVSATQTGAEGLRHVGKVFVFEVKDRRWNLVSQMMSPVIKEGHQFGAKVSLLGNLFAVSTRAQLGNKGYLYRLDGDQQISLVREFSSETDPSYGSNMKLFERTLFIQGSITQAAGQEEDGALGVRGKFVDVWTANDKGEWSKSQRLIRPPGSGQNRAFGHAISADQTTLAIGSPDERINGLTTWSYTGVVWVYEKNGAGQYELIQKLSPADGGGGDAFGTSVVVKGDLMVVGAPDNSNENGKYAGAIYIYKKLGSQWTLQKKFILPEGQERDQFGSSMSLDGTKLLVSRAARGTAFILDLK